MEKKIYAIHDEAKGEWDCDEIMLQINDRMAIRAFTGMIEEKDRTGKRTFIYEHADDFNLYCIGEFDKEEAIIAIEPEKIATAKSIREMIDKKEDEEIGRKQLN